MPGRDLLPVAEQLRAEGLPGELPCVIVSRAAQPDQQIVRTTLAQLERIASLPAPSILLAGEVLREADDNQLTGIAESVTVSPTNQPQPVQAE
jgi:siroheme synthase